MPEDPAPTSENLRKAAVYVLADELDVPADTIFWISSAVEVMARRKATSGPNSRELCAALLRDLNEYYTGDIETGLKKAGISGSEDIGRVVWGMVTKEIIRAEPGDDAANFNGLFRADNLEGFLAAEGIRRATVRRTLLSRARGKRYASRLLYLAGLAVVVGSWFGLVSGQTAWWGWGTAMTGFALGYVPDPKQKRF